MTKHAPPPMKTPETKPVEPPGPSGADIEARRDKAEDQARHDAAILHQALARVTRLLGYSDAHLPDHVGDIDATGVSEKYAGLVAFAKVAKLP